MKNTLQSYLFLFIYVITCKQKGRDLSFFNYGEVQNTYLW